MILTDSYILNYNFNFYSTLLSCLSCHDVTLQIYHMEGLVPLEQLQ